ncbi:MAG: hypothetical protein K2H20_02560, partial [Bacilli bacterium]|nr:hypothetical protein [Bacilli bacterium]
MNMTFNLTIENTEISKCNELPEGVLVPTLKITNKQLFDEALVKYVNRALEFYNPADFKFLENIDTDYSENINMSKSECLIKYIICTLLANASYDDFYNPVNFINSRTAMFDNRIINHEGELDLGYIESIGARIYVEEEISPIKSETPYRIKSYLEFDDGYKLLLPEIYAGNNGDKYQLYGIQKTTKNAEVDERPYLKQIRKGLIAKINGAPEHYFLTVMLFLSLCSDKEIEVVPFLIERWNAKRIAIHNKAKHNQNFSLSDSEKDQEMIQNNITDIFIRYFKKLEDVSIGIDFYAVPFELDSNLHIKMKEDFESRSVAFNEIFKLANEHKYQRNKFGK